MLRKTAVKPSWIVTLPHWENNHPCDNHNADRATTTLSAIKLVRSGNKKIIQRPVLSHATSLVLFSIFISLWISACSGKKSAPEKSITNHTPAEAYVIAPKDGERVSNPVTIQFGLKGMGIAPAGEAIPNTGHFHLLLDEDHLPPADKPMDTGMHYLHFGHGETEVGLDLSPGEHTLQLILGDANHFPHNPPLVSKKIKIIVE